MLITHLLGERARQRGDHPFILHEGRRVTYAEFDRLSNRAAHALRTLGVERGDRVTLALGNSVDYLAAAFGVLKAGAILHPVNPALGEHELRYILAHAEPRVIVADAASVERMSAPGLAPPGATLAAFGASGTLALDDLIAPLRRDFGRARTSGHQLLDGMANGGPIGRERLRHLHASSKGYYCDFDTLSCEGVSEQLIFVDSESFLQLL
jgi:non-ribosomal peptide synthetase component F